MTSTNTTDLRELIRKRGNLKCQLTHFDRFLKPIHEAYVRNEAISLNELKQLDIRTEKLHAIDVQFDDLQSQIETICEEDALEGHYNVREEFENGHSSSLATAQMILLGSAAANSNTKQLSNKVSAENNRPGSPVSIHSNASMTGETGNVNNSFDVQGIKLPTIDLPKFKGSHTCWLEFKDTYESLIHLNQTISYIQKYHYLRASLDGEALKIIQSLEFTSGNYTLAWDLLCKRYDNPHLLIHNHVKSIFELESISRESARGLRNIIDSLNKHLRSLDSLNQPTDHWDTLLIYIVSTKLDKATAKEWEKCRISKSVPTWSDMMNFLNSRADLLETLEINLGVKTKEQYRNVVALSSHLECVFCKGNHKIYKCEEFSKLSIEDRLKRVKALKLCHNCLSRGHFVKQCKSGHCQKCNSKHNTLLHYVPSVEVTRSCFSASQLVLLSTAVVDVCDSKGNKHKIRALLDSGSQSCFMSKKLHNFLDIDTSEINMSVIGINKGLSNINSKCELDISSSTGEFADNITCLIVPHITENLPTINFDISQWKIPQNINLADPNFNEPHEIHLLIGASHFWDILRPERINLGSGLPLLQNTVFGYIVSGSLNLLGKSTTCNLARGQTLNLNKFWEIEEVDIEQNMSPDDIDCEKHFTDNFSRDETGRFIVRIPLKYPVSHLGNSREKALRRFHNLEKKLNRDEVLRREYSNFMLEYIKLGHMSLSHEDSHPCYFLPHHSVVKDDSITTKTRVVFDASAVTDSGWSLNDIQYTGPSILNDLIPILLRFRQYTIVVCSDIEKMYRQILMNEKDRGLQQIFYRSSASDPVSVFRLNTVTYGTKSAPYLAIRCLKQLAYDHIDEQPVASNIILSDFYMDDLITGFQSEIEAVEVSQRIMSILLSAGFRLRKWNSNSEQVLNHLREKDDPMNHVNLGDVEYTKILGLRWITKTDELSFYVNDFTDTSLFTKRNILSDISKLFDPLGLVSPCILVSKLLIRSLWSSKVGWDEPVPSDLQRQWSNFRIQLPLLNQLRIKRRCVATNTASVQLHGFSDASTLGYGAAIYFRSIDNQQNIQTHLLCAKTRVAPIKVLTVPRLELCGALMLARLAIKVIKSLRMEIHQLHLWCDSEIVLCWLRTQPNSLQTFVANRVSQIQQLTCPEQWHHVNSDSNPADIASRGIFPKDIISSQLWWHGPQWLNHQEYCINQDVPYLPFEIPEMKKVVSSHICVDTSVFNFLSYSTLTRFKNIVAYVLRFISNCKLPNDKRLNGSLRTKELSNSLTLIVTLAQAKTFEQEIGILKNGSQLRTKLSSLCPFLDDSGVLRVGGRLRNCDIRANSKYPILLKGRHHLTRLIFQHYHKLYCHAPPQLLLSIVRQTYWPTSGMSVAKDIVRKCVRCFKFKPVSTNPLMSDLPRERVTITNPFHITGVDYAGPFILRDKKGRGSKSIRAYVSLFVCFVTKAIHLEVVTDLTTENFISALRRFTSRRGKPLKIYSDHGTNFIGARRELSTLQEFLSNSKNKISGYCSGEGITWKFIPPRSPHFGGLWEANIKQFKYHFFRIMGNTKLTYEEFLTVVIQIEGILNSRPLFPMSSDPNDLLPLTPSHFLIGKPLTTIPDPSLKDVPMSKLSRYQFLQKLYQDFWKSWSRDYLNNLQQRSKWHEHVENMKNGTLVIVKEENSPSCSWPMGRIVTTHPGSDGVVRVVDVKMKNGIFRRAVTKLCPLPIEDDPATINVTF